VTDAEGYAWTGSGSGTSQRSPVRLADGVPAPSPVSGAACGDWQCRGTPSGGR